MEGITAGSAIGTFVTILAMSFYGSTYLTDVLRRHRGKAPQRYMVTQFLVFWAFQSLLLTAFGHTLLNSFWLGALNSAGATVIGKVSCWAYMRDEAKKEAQEVTSHDD